MSAISKPSPAADPGGLRLRLVESPGSQSLDGAWWPHSRDLTRELTHLVREFPRAHGRITRALFSRPDWDTAPRRVDLGTRILKVGSFPNDDTHVIVVTTTDRRRITLLVVPPGYTEAQGAEAMLAASTPRNAHSGSEVLVEVTDNHDADPGDEWIRSEDGTPGEVSSRG